MNEEFDELARGMAQSVTRRGALKKFGVGIVGLGLAALGLPSRADPNKQCTTDADCGANQVCLLGVCISKHNCSKVKALCGGCTGGNYGCTTLQCVNECATACHHCFPGCC